MEPCRATLLWQTVLIGMLIAFASSLTAQDMRPLFMPEQRRLEIRAPEAMRPAQIPLTPPPPTVTHPHSEAPIRFVSLDEAVRAALENARVIRVLTGTTASASGQTIYDPAISNTTIDREQARFDPRVVVDNSFFKTDSPSNDFNPLTPLGVSSNNYNLNASVAKTVVTGADLSFNLNSGTSRLNRDLFLLNPQTRSSADITLTQPLWQGAGQAANMAPILVTRINTERSFFQYKDSVQELVRGVIEAYWAIVFARTDVWAREIQFLQAQEAFLRADALMRNELGNAAAAAQTRSAMANFRASLVTARANLLQREAALRNILGYPPYDPENIVPTTPPRLERLDLSWEGTLELAQVHRPDLIELKLIIEADEQLLIQANNRARPQLDALARYRWNGIEGQLPSGDYVASRPGQFTDWTLGVNFSVPLGLRQSRANLRQQELLIARDRVNLEQGLHATVHQLANNFRNLDQFYEQYEAFREAREAARLNLQVQWAEYRNNRVNFITVLQAITDWGNAVSAEAQSIVQYNIELANLERQSGTILEAHGVRFYEERYGTVGPLGRWHFLCYPASLPPTGNDERYPVESQPAEQVFNLDDPLAVPRPERSIPREELPSPSGPR